MRNKIKKLVNTTNIIDKTYAVKGRSMAVKTNIVVLFYAIANSKNLSQRQLRDEWMLPLSTINTITTEFRNAGYITLEPIPGKSPGAFAPEKPAARYRLRPGYPQPAL